MRTLNYCYCCKWYDGVVPSSNGRCDEFCFFSFFFSSVVSRPRFGLVSLVSSQTLPGRRIFMFSFQRWCAQRDTFAVGNAISHHRFIHTRITMMFSHRSISSRNENVFPKSCWHSEMNHTLDTRLWATGRRNGRNYVSENMNLFSHVQMIWFMLQRNPIERD